MTQEEKQLLLKDLCARLPYKVIANFTLGDISFNERVSSVFVNECSVQVYVKQGFLKCPLDGDSEIKLSQVKPYLRPMSSMTKEELKELNDKYGNIAYFFIQDPPYYYGLQAQHEDIGSIEISEFSKIYDWLDAHYFDYRIVPSTGKTLIESGLALEALKGMYKYEND